MGNRLFDNYTMFCLNKKGARMQIDITPLSTDHEIRKYMFSKHNQNAKQKIHKVIAYRVDDKRMSTVTSPEFLNIMRQKGIHLPNKLDEYIVLHAGLPVDTMSRKELMRYTTIQNENPSIRQPAA